MAVGCLNQDSQDFRIRRIIEFCWVSQLLRNVQGL